MPSPRLLALERLEDRCTPSTSGVAWPDNMHVTLSFVPDGTQVGNYQSSLFRTLNAFAPTATWQREILRAFQAWAAPANLNVGLVSDSGDPLGTTGAVQGDPRFGDIRIAAAPLAPGTLVTNTPFQWSGTTWSGDLVVNSNYLFSIAQGQVSGKYDLFTAMLNEAGNVFGVLDSHSDTASGCYFQYLSAKTGIDWGDIFDVTSLYGVRAPDQYDAARSNDTPSAATNLGAPLLGASLEGDISTPWDVDCYKIKLPLTNPGLLGFNVQVSSAGLSGLTPTVQVYDASGRLVGSAAATDPLNGTATVHVGGSLGGLLSSLLGGSTYTIRVTGGSPTVFGVGSYNLNVNYLLKDGTTTVLNTVNLLSTELGLNDVLGSATSLLPSPGQGKDARFDYTTKATLLTGSDVDYYKVVAPANPAAQKMNVIVWALERGGAAPKVDVFDAQGNAVAATLLANENGTFSVEVPDTTPGAAYYVKVSALYSAGHHAIGNYFLGADFTGQPETALNAYAGGTLNQSAGQAQQTLTVYQNRLYEYILSASSATAWTEVRMEIYDAGNNLVFSLDAYAGQPASSGHVYLKAGSYTVRFTGIAKGGTALPTVSYSLAGRVISDPIGPRTDSGSSTSTQQTDAWSGSSARASASTSWDQPYYY